MNMPCCGKDLGALLFDQNHDSQIAELDLASIEPEGIRFDEEGSTEGYQILLTNVRYCPNCGQELAITESEKSND